MKLRLQEMLFKHYSSIQLLKSSICVSHTKVVDDRCTKKVNNKI